MAPSIEEFQLDKMILANSLHTLVVPRKNSSTIYFFIYVKY